MTNDRPLRLAHRSILVASLVALSGVAATTCGGSRATTTTSAGSTSGTTTSTAESSSSSVTSSSSSGSGGAGGMGAGGGGGMGGGGFGGFAVWTNRYDNARSAANLAETTLSTATVDKDHFGLLFSLAVDGQMFAQPLYLSDAHIGGKKHNVVFAATAHNTVFAFDADDPKASAPLWSTSVGPSAPVIPGQTVSCQDMSPEVGITSTPVIDVTTGTMYVVAKGMESGNYIQRIHALDVLTGAERPGSPVVIQALVPGTGDASQNGMVAFDPQKQLNRPGLLLANGTIYAAFGSHCDDGPYHGWVLGYDAATLAQVAVYNTTPNGSEGGIWQSGMGPAADDSGIYIAVGNGSTDPTATPIEMSLGVVRLTHGTLDVSDWFLPSNHVALNDADLDLTSGPMLLPGAGFLLAGGKDGNIYVVDKTNFGHFTPVDNANLQTLQTGGHVHSGPVPWAGAPGGSTWVYLWPENSQLRAYNVLSTGLDPMPTSQTNLAQVPVHPGGVQSLSANGTTPGTGIVWATTAVQGEAWHAVAVGRLYAFDAADLTHELWDSDQVPDRDALDNFAKFNTPIVANGHVYVATFSNALRVYGILPL